MARNDVYLYINASDPADAVVTAQQTLTSATFPTLVLGDTPAFNFYFTDGTASWPSFAGSGSYSVAWALSDSIANRTPPYALQTESVAITGGWTIRLPLNATALINACAAKRVGQAWPVVQLWSHIRVTDPSGYLVSYALIRTNVRLRALADIATDADDPLPYLAFFNTLSSYNASSNASGNTSVAPSTYALQHVEVITVSGAGSTTRVAYISTTNRAAGHRCTIRFMCPATAGITLEVRNATAGGTLLLSTGTDGSGDDVVGEYYFDGTAWQPLSAQYVA